MRVNMCQRTTNAYRLLCIAFSCLNVQPCNLTHSIQKRPTTRYARHRRRCVSSLFYARDSLYSVFTGALVRNQKDVFKAPQKYRQFNANTSQPQKLTTPRCFFTSSGAVQAKKSFRVSGNKRQLFF